MGELRIDARKSLPVLKQEWENCTACTLGARRTNVGGHFVFGEGTPHAIMFIGEGPGEQEEWEGRPFVGPAGKLLHGVMEKCNCPEYYVTNLVSCRSCEPRLDKETGMPIVKMVRGVPVPRFQDISPLPVQQQACRNRLLEEIYLVDPVIIVTLGVPASEAVLGRSVTITREHGRAETISIPGATAKPSLTETKRAWRRKVNGEISWPTVTNEVRYLVIPTVHPSFVLRKTADLTSKGPFNNFVNDIRFAVKLYERYLIEVQKREPHFNINANFDDLEELYDND